jgi:hypothetical protein
MRTTSDECHTACVTTKREGAKLRITALCAFTAVARVIPTAMTSAKLRITALCAFTLRGDPG